MKDDSKNTVNSKQQRDKYFYGGNREKAIQRDGEKCVKCNMTRTEHQERYNIDITVDHIDGTGKNTPMHLKNNSLDNLQTLCFRCHGKKDGPRTRGSKLKVTFEDAQDIRMFKKSGMRFSEIAKGYQMVTYQTMMDIVNNKSHRVKRYAKGMES